ncbi:MAG: glycosyltransferase [Nitrosarchaeum sp.]
MRVLIVCSGNHERIATFITEQVYSLHNIGITTDFFTIKGKGIFGYFINLSSYLRKIKEFKPDIIHAHYGLSGVFANLQFKTPVITTYHGSDLNNKFAGNFSYLCHKLSNFNIHVFKNSKATKWSPNKINVIPCGVDFEMFDVYDREKCRKSLGFEPVRHYILFAGAFDNPVKNSQLAKDSIQYLENTELIELKGKSREEVAILLNAVDALLLTSHSEGSPQIVKEALACNCPVVAVNVGDLKEQYVNFRNCKIVPRNPLIISNALVELFSPKDYFNSRQELLNLSLDLKSTAEKIRTIYAQILS